MSSKRVRHRRVSPTRKILLAKRKKLLSEIRAATRPYDQAAQSGHPGRVDDSRQLKKLQSTIHDLQHELTQEGAANPRALAALQQVDTSLVELARAHQAHDPRQAMSLLEAALKALNQASSEAKKAGHDWPL
jgi:hypothetical protein